MSDVHWFRAPTDGDAGTLNACYDALDIHVVRGHADDVALTDPDGDWTFARLLTDVAACEMEQPTASYETSSTTPEPRWTRSVTSSPQVGLTWCTSASKGSRSPAWWGCL